MLITKDWLYEHLLKNSNANYDQLRLLDVEVPPSPGWADSLVGKYISLATSELVVRLSGLTKRERDRILKDTRQRDLF